jgi:hypothetical protein
VPTPGSRADALPQQRGDRFAARTGFDPRARELMRDGRWLV